jgi:hypothetical protein
MWIRILPSSPMFRPMVKSIRVLLFASGADVSKIGALSYSI